MKSLFFFGTLFLVALSARATSITFTDTTFNLANYSESPLFKTNASDSFTFAQCPTCGNPGLALQTIATLTNSLDTAALGFVNNTFSYNPSVQGAISSIDASVDKDLSTNVDATGAGNTFRPLIEQNGMFYLAAIPGPPVSGTTTGYNTIAQFGLVATDFVQFDFSSGNFITGSNPNFAGGPMLLGLAQRSQAGVAGEVIEADYDNLNLTIHSVPDNGSTAAMLLLGIFILLMARPKTIRGAQAHK